MFGYDKTENYIEMWDADKKSMMHTMYKNMVSDLDCGYSPIGACIQRQKENIARYEAEYFNDMEKLIDMEESAANRWCFMDMKRRGVIL